MIRPLRTLWIRALIPVAALKPIEAWRRWVG